MTIYMQGTQDFIVHCQRPLDMRRMSAFHLITLEWADLQTMAREYDSRRQLTDDSAKQGKPSQEAKRLAGNQTYGNRTRSGNAGIHAVDAQSPRGRGQQYNPDNRGSTPNSQSGYVSGGSDADPRRNRNRTPSRDGRPQGTPKSPKQSGNPGTTPFKFQRGNPGASSSNQTNIAAVEMNVIGVNLIKSIEWAAHDAVTDDKPIVISTLHHIQPSMMSEVSISSSNKRGNLPEGVSQEELDADREPLNLLEAMRRGLRQVQNLPIQNPYAKLLSAQFMLTFRQLAGLCMDEEFRDVCKQLLELSLKRDARQETVASSRAAVTILRVALADLPHAKLQPGMRIVPTPSQDSEAIPAGVHNIIPQDRLIMAIVGMAKVEAFLDERCSVQQYLKLDSGAAISCLSHAALIRDRDILLMHGTLHKLLTPMILSGFSQGHTQVTMAVEAVNLTIGKARYTHNFLVVPNLICDYLIGQDFMATYDLRVNVMEKTAMLGIVEEEWLGPAGEYQPYQDIDLLLSDDRAVLTTSKVR